MMLTVLCVFGPHLPYKHVGDSCIEARIAIRAHTTHATHVYGHDLASAIVAVLSQMPRLARWRLLLHIVLLLLSLLLVH